VRSKLAPSAILMLCLASGAYAGTNNVVPTTTLTAETGNNTSAASTFTPQSDGNLGAGNVSKVSIRTLLYAGSNTPIYAHFMGWFGQSNHMSVGYTSSSGTQVKAQVSDALSRGISGFILDWYGPNNSMPNNTALALMNEAQSRGGAFQFGIMYDGGALGACAATSGCNLNQQAINDLTYAYNNFEQSSAYMTSNGRPVVWFFSPDRYGTLNWAQIASSVPGNPLFVFQNSGGFTHGNSSGSFSWVIIDTSNAYDWNQSYLDNFYLTSFSYPQELTYGTGYKGFNDSLAAWGANRIMNQQCGQVWMNTLAEIGRYFSASNQLNAIQLVTWNDYEEGSELETGIDNCVSLSATLTANVLSWSVTGNLNTVDHFTVFISSDGENLMSLGDLPATATSLNLTSAAMAPGSYTLHVKAVGKPSLANKMSQAVAYSVADLPPTAQLSVTPTSGVAPLVVNASTAGSTDADGTIVSSSINFGDGSATVAGPAASHTYTVPGTYALTATVTDNSGLSSTATATVMVKADQPPVVELTVTPSSGASPLAVAVYANSSYDPDGTITASKITFGDGASASGISANHTYTGPGTYTVSATLTDNAGLSSTASTVVQVYGVKVTSPANGTTLSSPVHVAASATSAHPITAMRIYVDNISRYATNSSSLNRYVSLSAGTHYVVVQAWDSTGAVFKTPVNITVK